MSHTCFFIAQLGGGGGGGKMEWEDREGEKKRGECGGGLLRHPIKGWCILSAVSIYP